MPFDDDDDAAAAAAAAAVVVVGGGDDDEAVAADVDAVIPVVVADDVCSIDYQRRCCNSMTKIEGCENSGVRNETAIEIRCNSNPMKRNPSSVAWLTGCHLLGVPAIPHLENYASGDFPDAIHRLAFELANCPEN